MVEVVELDGALGELVIVDEVLEPPRAGTVLVVPVVVLVEAAEVDDVVGISDVVGIAFDLATVGVVELGMTVTAGTNIGVGVGAGRYRK